MDKKGTLGSRRGAQGSAQPDLCLPPACVEGWGPLKGHTGQLIPK